MRHNTLFIGLKATLAIFTLALFVINARAASHQVLHSFDPNGVDAAYPYAGLIADAAGNRYGTAGYGGTHNVGAVFEISSRQGGGWTEKLLYSFDNNGIDGTVPQDGVIFDAAGNLYGTTNTGGIHGLGAVFELTPNGSGGWTETVLHSFGDGSTDGASPYGGLIFDSAGNLYATTQGGGVYGEGTVVKLSPRQGGGWTEIVVHNFNPSGTDGINPEAGLVRDSAGNMYGTTYYGGIHGYGAVFKLTPNGSGGWTESVLHSLGNGTDGRYPYASLIVDAGGNLYGTTVRGGIHNLGAVFELSPHDGSWTETVLHSFGNGTDGISPEAGLVRDGAGNLYGTTASGGIHAFGTVFELKPNGSGGWTETVLHSFNIDTADGANPYAGLILDGAGNLYGTTLNGGISEGTVFELSPQQNGSWTESMIYPFNFNGTDGGNPAYGALIGDGAGNLYGTASAAGAYDSGVLFELSPNGSGGWTEKVVHNFGLSTDGSGPDSGLVFDAAGNLYGTNVAGGIHNSGTAFELSPDGSGGWTEKVLHSFGNGTDGKYPFDSLVIDRLGNLYGTTYRGGIHNYGTVFELSPNGSGGWTETVLHSFNFNGADGALPYAGLAIDSAGNLYGTTPYGGINYSGAVFELSPNGSGGWTEKIVHSFNYTDGAFPTAGLIFDSANNLYGTTETGGIHGYGSVFQLTPQQNGSWTEKVLLSFNGMDGASPEGSLVRFGSSANLYGTTSGGGVNGAGTVFEMTPTEGGNWAETVLHNFSPGDSDGNYPQGSLIFDSTGNLYGATPLGGTFNSGTVFEITP
ncbi:MAG: choice-of-anchor tandem repeat GloVer-containing protein [Candidatus Korobacteraceae bacterium]